MRRSYILPGEAGLLWLGFQEERTGIWFAFSPQDPPPGVAAAYILDAAPAPTVRPLHTYRVESADLLVSFGVRRGPLPDPRLGRAYAPTEYAWPVR
jgi:hypothetical protein